MSSISTGLWLGVHGSFRASVLRTCLRRRPHRLPLQRPSRTMAPTSALVAVSAGMTVSLLEPSSCQPTIIRVVMRSAGLGTYFVIGDCVSCRGRTFPQDDCVLVPVVCDRTQSSCRKYVLDGAHGRRPCAAILGWFRQGLLYERSGECRRVGPQIVDVTQIGGVVAVVEVGLESRVALCRLRPHVAD